MQALKSIRCVITDLDGILTDGCIYLNTEGYEAKAFHVHDGFGLKLLQSVGFHIGLITTSNNAIVDKRMKQLGISDYFSGQKNKVDAYNQLLERFDVSDKEVLVIGDDLPDLALLKRAGFAATVADAIPDVKSNCDFISKKPGGRGAVREICDLLLDAQGLKQRAIEKYLDE